MPSTKGSRLGCGCVKCIQTVRFEDILLDQMVQHLDMMFCPVPTPKRYGTSHSPYFKMLVYFSSLKNTLSLSMLTRVICVWLCGYVSVYVFSICIIHTLKTTADIK